MTIWHDDIYTLLCICSEQQQEAQHYIYDAIWERSYKVKDLTCDLFHDNSLKAVLENNVDNL